MNTHKIHKIGILLITLALKCTSNERLGLDYVISNTTYSTADTIIGATGTITGVLKNQGQEDGLSKVTLNLYTSPYNYLDKNKITLAATTTTGSGVKTGGESPFTLNYTIPAGATKTTYLLIEIITTDTESDKFNNIWSSAPIMVTDGVQNRTTLLANGTVNLLNIGAGVSEYYEFATITGHSYSIQWDDFSEGVTYLNSGADITLTAMSSDNSKIYFTGIDKGYYFPQSTTSVGGLNVFLDITSTGNNGSYSIKITDIGTPPDVTITITSVKYSNVNTALTFNYTITNPSGIAINNKPVSIGFWAALGAAPLVSDPADNYTSVTLNLAAGASMTGVYDLITNATPGNNAYIAIDTSNALVEMDENNNVGGPVGW